MIRKARFSEIEKLTKITMACAEKMNSENILQWDENYPNRSAFENDEKRGELFVLIIKDNIAGCITISTLKDKEYDEVSWLTVDGKNLYIHRLAVHPDFQHQGNAKSLMDFAESLAKKQSVSSIRLDTFSKNKRNQKFYLARGYEQVGQVYFPRQAEHPFYCYELVLD